MQSSGKDMGEFSNDFNPFEQEKDGNKSYETLITEVYCDGRSDFDNYAKFNILKCGDILEDLYLKIVLPILPDNVKWKENIIYKLISKIEIITGGSTIVKYTSSDLELIDKITNSCEKIKLVRKLNNIIYYPINIKSIFGNKNLNFDKIPKSTPVFGPFPTATDPDFIKFALERPGINIFSIYYPSNGVKIFIKIGNIFELLDYNEVDQLTINIINNLELQDLILVAKYSLFRADPCLLQVEQDINYWINKTYSLSIDKENIIKLEYEKTVKKLNKLILIFNTDNTDNIDNTHMIISCTLQIKNGNEVIILPGNLSKNLNNASNNDTNYTIVFDKLLLAVNSEMVLLFCMANSGQKFHHNIDYSTVNVQCCSFVSSKGIYCDEMFGILQKVVATI